MHFYATRTMKGYWFVKAQNRNDIYNHIPEYVKKQIIDTLSSKGMDKKKIEPTHIVAVFWNVKSEEIKVYIQERESQLKSTQQELDNFKSLLHSPTPNKMFSRRI